MSTYDAVKDLPLEIDGYELGPLEQEVAANFTLKRTVVVLRGGGVWGRGEEVDYDPAAQERFQARRGELPFAGHHTLDSFSLLQAGQTEYRRWAFESAALDLALRQAGLTLGRGARQADAAAPVRRLDAQHRRRAVARARTRAALQARPRPRLAGHPDRAPRRRRLRRHGRLQGHLPCRVRLTTRSRALRPHRRRVPGRLDRGSRADAGDARRARRASRPDHLGRGDPRVERRRGAARSSLAA